VLPTLLFSSEHEKLNASILIMSSTPTFEMSS